MKQFTEIFIKKCLSAKNSEKKNTDHETIPGLNCWCCCFLVHSPWLWKENPFKSSDLDQCLFQKCSEESLRSRNGISIPFKGSKNSLLPEGFPVCNCYPCGNLKSAPVSRTFLCAWSTLDVANLILFHVFPLEKAKHKKHSSQEATQIHTQQYTHAQNTSVYYLYKYTYTHIISNYQIMMVGFHRKLPPKIEILTSKSAT